MRVFGAVLFGLCGSIALGQASSTGQVRFIPRMGEQPLLLDSATVLGDDVPVTITTFRFYVGQCATHRKGGWVSVDHGYHLVDAADPFSCAIDLGDALASADSISFLLGVDSLTNVSGAFGGDLDPIKGMYWAWNSGYINLKLEGNSPVSPYPSRTFELHLGGYLPPFAAVQRITLPIPERPLIVRVDVKPLLRAAGVHMRCNVMSPSERAVYLSKVAATMFKVDASH